MKLLLLTIIALHNPLIFTDPTGKDNIIYLVATGDFDKDKAKEQAAAATKILSDLGVLQ